MLFLIPKSFVKSDMVLWYVMKTMSGILKVTKMSDIFEFLIYTNEFLVWLLIVIKIEWEYWQRDNLVILKGLTIR